MNPESSQSLNASYADPGARIASYGFTEEDVPEGIQQHATFGGHYVKEHEQQETGVRYLTRCWQCGEHGEITATRRLGEFIIENPNPAHLSDCQYATTHPRLTTAQLAHALQEVESPAAIRSPAAEPHHSSLESRSSPTRITREMLANALRVVESSDVTLSTPTEIAAQWESILAWLHELTLSDQASGGPSISIEESMRFERDYSHLENRVASFSTWPRSQKKKPSPETLAEAGFYYTGNDKAVKCAGCDLEIRYWKTDTKTIKEHKRLRGNVCEFIRASTETRQPPRSAPTPRGRRQRQRQPNLTTRALMYTPSTAYPSGATVHPSSATALSSGATTQLPDVTTIALDPNLSDEVKELKQCPICFANEKNLSFECGHAACRPCIEKFIHDNKYNCHICRKAFKIKAIRKYFM